MKVAGDNVVCQGVESMHIPSSCSHRQKMLAELSVPFRANLALGVRRYFVRIEPEGGESVTNLSVKSVGEAGPVGESGRVVFLPQGLLSSRQNVDL